MSLRNTNHNTFYPSLPRKQQHEPPQKISVFCGDFGGFCVDNNNLGTVVNNIGEALVVQKGRKGSTSTPNLGSGCFAQFRIFFCRKKTDFFLLCCVVFLIVFLERNAFICTF
jgi:hypothetical protein